MLDVLMSAALSDSLDSPWYGPVSLDFTVAFVSDKSISQLSARRLDTADRLLQGEQKILSYSCQALN